MRADRREFTASAPFTEFETWPDEGRANVDADASAALPVRAECPVLPLERRQRAIRAIDSYLVRRAILNLSSHDHNHVFRELVGASAQQPECADEAVIKALPALQGPHRQWPTDAQLRAALEQDPLESGYAQGYARQPPQTHSHLG